MGDEPLGATEQVLARFAADLSRRWEYRSAIFGGDHLLDDVVKGIVADGHAVGVANFRPYSPLWGLGNVVHDLSRRLELATAQEAELAQLRLAR